MSNLVKCRAWNKHLKKFDVGVQYPYGKQYPSIKDEGVKNEYFDCVISWFTGSEKAMFRAGMTSKYNNVRNP